MSLKFIVMTCEGREHYLNSIKGIPNLLVSYDNFTDAGKFTSTAFKNSQQAWDMAGESATVQMEDDIILCDFFYDKITKAIAERPNDVIQFYSSRKKDLTVGSRYEYGGNFLAHLCYYLPKGMAKEIYKYSFEYEDACDYGQHRSPNDLVTQTYFKKNKIKYWLHCPNLVNHRIGKSKIDPRRSSKRQSLSFVSGS